MLWNLTKAGPLDPPLGSKPRIHNPTCQNMYQVIQENS